MSQNPGQDPNQSDPYRPGDTHGTPQDGPMGYQPAPSYDASGIGQQASITKPPSVDLAQKLMYAGALLSLLSSVLVLLTPEDELRQQIMEGAGAGGQTLGAAELDAAVMGATIGALAFGVLFAAIWFMLGVFNGKGKGWARIVATALGAINVISTLVTLVGANLLPGAATGGALDVALSLVSAALAAFIVVLLWRKESSAFFAATR